MRTWSPEDGARLPEQRSEPLALLATDDTVDLLVSYQRAASVAGLEFPAATALAREGLPHRSHLPIGDILSIPTTDRHPPLIYALTATVDVIGQHPLGASILAKDGG